MAQFSKNFLPIFFTLYANPENNDHKDALLKLITSYVKISEPQVQSKSSHHLFPLSSLSPPLSLPLSSLSPPSLLPLSSLSPPSLLPLSSLLLPLSSLSPPS